MSEQNKAAIRRWLEEGINQGNLAALDELVAPNYVYHGPGMELRGPEALKQLVAVFRTAFPDLHTTIDDMVAEGDKVVTRWTATGTHRGEFMGMAPTGRSMTLPIIVITRFEAGKAVEDWEVYDGLGLMQQLGASK
jgi:steroid delta-isomerase-like uncharacterized protein